MKYLRKFESFPGDNYSLVIKDKTDGNSSGTVFSQDEASFSQNSMYDVNWEKHLPDTITINYHNEIRKFKKGNVMLVGDLVEITYDPIKSEWGKPDTLEFDLYFVKDNNTNKMRIDIDITYGDLMACEFSIESPNNVHIIQHTTYRSKFDPSNTVFAIEDESLDELIVFLNKFPGFKLTRHDLRFLDKYDNCKE